MAAQRLPRKWLIAAAIAALAGLFAFVCSTVWIWSLAGAEGTGLATALFVGAALASLAMIVAIPVLHAWDPPRWARIAVPIVVGVLALVAAGAVWVLMSVVLCGDDGLCRPVDTWRFLPVAFTVGVCAAAGPGIAALMSPWDPAGHHPWRGRLLAVAVVTGLIGVLVALVAWVELNLYPLS